ncbi:MAG: DUF899 domain-containing protein [Rhodospirillales bacterium]|nr:DUF899 domain-containing protein [Rhodospirillales bacterium]
MAEPRIVSHEEWLKARTAFMAKEKEFMRLRDELARQRRALPWERVEKDYVFEAPEGRVTLADLFDGKSQLIVDHFMFGPDYEEGCPSCSFWADNFNGIDAHLAARDTVLVVVSRAPLSRFEPYKRRMGWTFRWVSSAGSDFNYDYGVSRRPGENLLDYNYGTLQRDADEHPGVSAFVRQGDAVFHTYSTYARGLDPLNGAYQLLDLTARGRQEERLPFPMAWVRPHDRY